MKVNAVHFHKRLNLNVLGLVMAAQEEARLFGSEGVRSASIHEGAFREQVDIQTPLGRIGEPGDAAPVVSFLASAESGWVTGETLLISGGMQ